MYMVLKALGVTIGLALAWFLLVGVVLWPLIGPFSVPIMVPGGFAAGIFGTPLAIYWFGE